jgi:hypothetical protein
MVLVWIVVSNLSFKPFLYAFNKKQGNLFFKKESSVRFHAQLWCVPQALFDCRTAVAWLARYRTTTSRPSSVDR